MKRITLSDGLLCTKTRLRGTSKKKHELLLWVIRYIASVSGCVTHGMFHNFITYMYLSSSPHYRLKSPAICMYVINIQSSCASLLIFKLPLLHVVRKFKRKFRWICWYGSVGFVSTTKRWNQGGALTSVKRLWVRVLFSLLLFRCFRLSPFGYSGNGYEQRKLCGFKCLHNMYSHMLYMFYISEPTFYMSDN